LNVIVPDRDLMTFQLLEALQSSERILIVVQDSYLHFLPPRGNPDLDRRQHVSPMDSIKFTSLDRSIPDMERFPRRLSCIRTFMMMGNRTVGVVPCADPL